MDFDDETALSRIHGPRMILRFALPSVAMMLLISSFNIVDGLYVSNFISTDALAALNILMPVFSLLTAIGFMLATGGSAYVSNRFGRGEPEEARAAFSQIMLAAAVFAVVASAIAIVFMDPLVRLLGADDSIAGLTAEYGRMYSVFAVFLMMQFLTNQFLIVAGKPPAALALSVVGGVSNIVLDYVMIVSLQWGMSGAALASGLSSAIPAVVALILLSDRRSDLHFTVPSRDVSVMKDTCTNGVSEMVSELSGGVTSLLFNLVMMHYIGPDGVSAISILMYVQFLALAAMIGYSNGVAPLMSYRHGAQDRRGMHEAFRVSSLFIFAVSVAIFAVMEVFAGSIVSVFAGGSESVMKITVHGAAVFSVAFLFMGANMYASSLFTSLSNGLVSAVISFFRTLLFLAPLIVLLPMAFGIDAIWAAVPLAEGITFVMAAVLIKRLGPGYGYLGAVE